MNATYTISDPPPAPLPPRMITLTLALSVEEAAALRLLSDERLYTFTSTEAGHHASTVPPLQQQLHKVMRNILNELWVWPAGKQPTS